MNGQNFGVWEEFDLNGKIISQIDYSIPQQTIGQNQPHFKLFQEYLEIADSLLNAHFDSEFKKSIKLNAPRSYWYSEKSSGSWFETAPEEPVGFTLRYSVILRDTLHFTPIEIRLKNKQVTYIKGVP